MSKSKAGSQKTRRLCAGSAPRVFRGKPGHQTKVQREQSETRLTWAIEESRLLSHDFAIAPNVDRRAMSARDFPGGLGRAPQRPECRRHPLFRTFAFSLFVHGPVSINRGVSPELSYTSQRSASAR